jgi:hypothetical protein
MVADENPSTLESIVREVVETVSVESVKLAASKNTQARLASIARRDYERRMNEYFSGREIRKLLAALQVALPGLNREVFHVTDVRRFAAIAASMGARFKANFFGGEDGRGLRGFYVADTAVLKQPLICVNKAHHPVAVTTAFLHELGHHLTARLVEKSHKPVNLSLTADYDEHLGDPLEVVADMIVVLSAYPKPAARQLFGSALRRGRVPDIEEIVSGARTHLHAVAGFEFQRRFATENLHYLVGMTHYAKLRWALFAEYQI